MVELLTLLRQLFLVFFEGLIKCNLENRTVAKTLALQPPYSGLIICPPLISKEVIFEYRLSIDSL